MLIKNSNGMNQKVEKILNDLYMIDANFKKQEKELMQIIQEMLDTRPDVKVDEEFVNRLRLSLARRALYMKEEKTEKSGSAFSFVRFAYSIAGVALLLVIAASFGYYFAHKITPVEVAVNTEKGIERVRDNAFGLLSFGQTKGGTSGAEANALGKGGGFGGAPAALDKNGSAIFPAPDMVNYRYIYKGGDFTTMEKAAVYRRLNDFSSGTAADTLRSLDVSVIDLEKFQNMSINNLSFTENRSFGYEVRLDFMEGVVYLNRGTGWPDPYAGCSDQECFSSRQLKASDLPKNEELKAIANNFLNNYGIDKSAYGEPKVIKDYGWFPAVSKGVGGTTGNAENIMPGTAYVSEVSSVVYPLKINRQIVYDDAFSAGMVVEVNNRDQKVNAVRNIYSQKYESSDYEAEQDTAKIISLAEKGGTNGNYESPEAARTVDVELGTPTVELIATWNYDPEKRASESMFVPSYVFPVIKAAEDQNFWRKNVIVPVPKELLEKFGQSSSTTPGLFQK